MSREPRVGAGAAMGLTYERLLDAFAPESAINRPNPVEEVAAVRVAVVTGAASGIGRAAAERIVAEGGSVVAVDRAAGPLAWAAGHAHIAVAGRRRDRPRSE